MTLFLHILCQKIFFPIEMNLTDNLHFCMSIGLGIARAINLFRIREESMNLFKKLGLAVGAIAFCFSLLVATSYAQDRQSRYRNNDRSERNWNNSQRKYQRNDRSDRRYSRYSRYNNNNRYSRYNQYNRYNRYGGRINPREARRLARQRARIYNSRNRYQRDGYISPREQRKLYKQTTKYRRNVRRDRRDW